MNQHPRFFSPAETARRLKVSTKALRLYESLGLVNPVRASNGWRTYGPDQMVRLHQVLALKSLGVPLKRIGELLSDELADLDAVLLLQEAAFRSRMAGDARRLELLVAVRRRLANGESLSVDDLIDLTRETVMTDPNIFISYAPSTEAGARKIGEALRAMDYGVWRNDDLPSLGDYAQVIEERLTGAKAVVVVWSAEAVESYWVRSEADLARKAGTLVQLSLDGAVPPQPFDRIPCARLAGWSGDLDAPDWRKVVESIANRLGGAGARP
ncbi:MAG TPA: TIR domain-containing protein [Caulobacteraceae bacterium]|nr:TIR domain-containing protein [Caulobacteraceae bacterium]